MDISTVSQPWKTDIHYVFERMFSQHGKLVAVECLSRFNNEILTPEEFFHSATPALRTAIFLDQLALIESRQSWFARHHITVTLNVDDDILDLFHDAQFIERIHRIPCVHFEINEHSQRLLSDFFSAIAQQRSPVFWLDDYGSGYAGIDVIRRHHFGYIKINKDAFWFLEDNAFGQHYMRSLLSFLHNNQHHVIIEGVENQAQIDWLAGMDWYALQGHYWPALSMDELIASV
ncbi:EAL domain-containing protein [Shimwellia blattae]|uniref:Putative cyclic diguanylate phosphodiesterase n=1 Tax=Shimwellia blattae (strain ATCC 29907 / DSM 4481 / JCM 1650 / NBRC 105725 / CDC 9005-74) TaxID=630626 RepID=I2B3S4_SHIBC|nr:EAL domain-containing protein [Shimwellia blattae]AFJ45178.1 putative cyclic diguanylate phosphodiesterase [Shimwellia blattae DSM 4481 = NBRC 105725]GAB80705.1 putative cyclic di-GMP phosphodiesterase [Shimwellia blattae DSM 4481 = NBRC 105725]VDY62660.1 Cyclic di-GMP phosphodiesterase YhjH [Shimwellia blattae]VEC19386.1 Cyclic di-GMP phosphodiesterase YhjH [Shimwellia blattae]